MMVTNLCKSPTSRVKLKNGDYTSVNTVNLTAGVEYYASFYIEMSGTGSYQISGVDGTFTSGRRFTKTFTSPNSNQWAIKPTVVSGTPTFTAFGILLCTKAEYQACQTLLDQIHYFTGDTMPQQN